CLCNHGDLFKVERGLINSSNSWQKRTVSEVQLMHNLGEHKQVQERREWLQRRLHGWEIQNALNVLEELLKSQE
uniref:Parathyroid hormone n=1 Tax=Takifugu rubripes TaxID=31033 RepID=A0A674NB34_TAKRU